ncbi:DHHC palmitoyltransferase-domain-containing protein [Suillus ampliporus]|nr:DHHC palmitoyltransferase-domain-containing protein [Suillus ampliporus]
MICARHVFRCFKWLERAGDRITDAAGPYFVGLAVILQTVGATSFYEALQPGSGWLWASPSRTSRLSSSGIWWSDRGITLLKASTTNCRRCGLMRPERAHHCRICGWCVMKYDHHCPLPAGINQCVGLHNERHFVLFMYLLLSTFCLTILSYSVALEATYSLAYILTYTLHVVLCIVVFIMFCWHLWGVSRGETTIEAQDHEVYKRIAKDRGDACGSIRHDDMHADTLKSTNLRLFFNIGPDGYPSYTLVLSLRIMPYTDGRSWARREGLQRHQGVQEGEELTDDRDNESTLFCRVMLIGEPMVYFA